MLKIIQFSVLITVLIFVAIIALLLYATSDSVSYITKSDIELNELGDFLAGMISPIAFLWLIVTMVLQVKQLDTQTKSLDAQQQALLAQINEMEQTRGILTQETEYMKSTLALQNQVNYTTQLNILYQQIIAKAQQIVKHSSRLSAIDNEDEIDTIIRVLSILKESNQTEELRKVINLRKMNDLKSLLESYINIDKSIDIVLYDNSNINELFNIINDENTR